MFNNKTILKAIAARCETVQEGDATIYHMAS
jgi:hypothetical protein